MECSKPGHATANRFRIDDLTLDFALKRVYRGRKTIDLPTLSFELLAELARAAPATLSCDALIERVWNGAVVNEETVTQRVRLLRRALGDGGRHPRYIVSDRGRGYRLASLPRPAGSIVRRHPVWLWATYAILTLLATGLVVVAAIQFRLPDTSPMAAAPKPGAEDLVAHGWTYFSRHQVKDNEIALELFRRALDHEPGNVRALAGLSMAHAQRAMKFNYPVSQAHEAERIARRALARDPDSLNARMALATALDATGRVPEAIEAYEKTLELGPEHAGVLSSVAYLYQVRGELTRGLEYALRARALDPDLPYVDLQIGQTLRILGFEAAGETYLLRADTLRPDNIFAAAERVRHLLATGRFREAEDVVREALVRDIRRPELHEYRGVLAMMRDDHEAASAAFRDALALDPESEQALTGALVIALRRGDDVADDYRERVRTTETAWSRGDRWPGLMFQLVQLHTAFGDLEAAQSALERLVDAGFRDAALFLAWPGLEPLRRQTYFQDSLERMNRAVLAEREEFLAAEWRPDQLFTASPPAARAARNP